MKNIKIEDKKVIQIGSSLGITLDHKVARKHNIKKGDTLEEIKIKKNEG
jgi:hypothetical protein